MNLLDYAQEERDKAEGRRDACKDLIRFTRKTQKRSESVLVCEGPIIPKILKHLDRERKTWAEGLKTGGPNATYKHARLMMVNELMEELKREE